MRELRLKYIIQMVSDIAARAKDDQQALTTAQKAVKKVLEENNREISLMEKLLLRVGRVHGQSIDQQAQYLSRLALRYQDVRKAAEGAAKAMQSVATVGTGAAAGAYAIDRMARAPMEYSLRLAHMANTAYADRGVAGRIAGKQTLNAAITAAVRTGGGTRDGGVDALDFLIASGALGNGDAGVANAIKMLPTIMRSATASGAMPKEMAGIAVRSFQNFKIAPDQLGAALNMAMVAGQAGGFELKDMASWLPQQMAMGGNIGLSGMEGLRKLVAWNQASVLTAGSKDQAGNNLRDLLMELNTPHFKGFLAQAYLNDGRKLKPGERAGQLKSVDDIFLDYQSKGVDRVDATLDIMGKVFAKNPKYVALQAQLAGATGTEDRRAILEAMAAQVEGSAVGKVFHNQQSLMAFLGLMNNREYVKNVMDQTRTNTGAMDDSFAVISKEVSFARQRAITEGEIGADRSFQAVAPALGELANTAASTAQKFPTLTAGVVGATGAVAAFTAALGTSGLIGVLTGRAGNAGGVVGSAATLATGGASAAAGALLRGGPWWARAGGAMAAPLVGAGLDAYSTFADDSLTAAGKVRGYVGAGAGLGGGIAGALGGAAAGSLLGPVGTLLGGVVGGIGGSMGGKAALDWLWKRDPARDVVGPDGQVLPAAGGRIELGQGKVDVNVSVRDDRVSVGLVPQGSPTLQINAGNTNPAWYSKP